MNEKKQFNVAVYFLWFFLIFVPPLGLLMLWFGRYKFSKIKKFIMSLAFCLYFVVILAYATSDTSQTDKKVAKSNSETTASAEKDAPKTEAPKVEAPKVEAPKVEAPKVEAPKVEAPKVEAPKVSLGQKNALKAAIAYIDYTPFSYLGLIDQLAYEGYSAEDSTYAADNCGADWNEQAALQAKAYLDFSSFSRQSLIDQLVFGKFTAEQAAFGAAAVGY